MPSSSVGATEHRRLLREEAAKSQLLINYVVCNFEDVDRVHPLIGQVLAIYYRKGVGRFFAIQLLPQLVYLYLCALQSGHQQAITMFETFFLALYNEEILAGGPGADEFTKRVDVFRIPSIRCPSVYHDPVKLNTVADLPTADYRLNSAASATLCSVHIGPYPAIETIIGENRFIVLTRLMTSISNSIDNLALEALTVVNFCVFNGYAAAGLRALDAVHQRAIFDISADVLLVTNAMRDLLNQDETRRLIQEIEKSPTKTNRRTQ
ncbi:hypothetical protein M3Y99_01816400 [Aphelenchoides fujianensis]|nr:hypothetical protein M3Y99_01816400 [Aphelenchoides fujianensis]